MSSPQFTEFPSDVVLWTLPLFARNLGFYFSELPILIVFFHILCLCSVEHIEMAMGRSYISNCVGRSCSPHPDFCMPFLAERDTMHNYYVQRKSTALRGASDGSIIFESCLAAVDDPVHDNSTGWVASRDRSVIFDAPA